MEVEASPKLKLANCLVKKVAAKLGNTVAVCKAHYIHPSVQAIAADQEIDVEKLNAKAASSYKDLKDQLSDAELTALYLIDMKGNSTHVAFHPR
jgi:DNA topoisomerase IB